MEIPRSSFLRLAVVFVVMSGCSVDRASAWDDGGHQIIAAIAYSHLNPQAQKAVAEFAREMQSPSHPYDAVTLACWMDDLRRKNSKIPYHGEFLSWHYINLGIEDGDPEPSWNPGDDDETHGNVVQGLKRALAVLKGGTDPCVQSKAMACAMVMHLVGDIHQPLHAATHYFRSRGRFLHDEGGNKEEVANGPLEGPQTSLHMFWDSAWRASFDENTGRIVFDEQYDDHGKHDPALLQPLVDLLLKQAPPSDADRQTHIDQWARESNQIARAFVYRDITATESRKYCRLSSSYVAKANDLARQRLVLAAYRLAMILNETLGVEHK